MEKKLNQIEIDCLNLMKTVYRDLAKYDSHLYTWSDIFISDTLLALGAPQQSYDVETMSTDGNSIVYNPSWLYRYVLVGEKYAMEKVKFFLVHEAMHIVLCHPLEFNDYAKTDKRRRLLMNVACDLAINSMLDGSMLPKDVLLPGRGLFSDLPSGKDARWYYDKLLTSLSSNSQKMTGNSIQYSDDNPLQNLFEERDDSGSKSDSASNDKNKGQSDIASSSGKTESGSDGKSEDELVNKETDLVKGMLDRMEQKDIDAIPEKVFEKLKQVIPEGGEVGQGADKPNPNGFNQGDLSKKQLREMFDKKAHTIKQQYHNLSMGKGKILDSKGYPHSVPPDSSSTGGLMFNLKDLAVAGIPKITGNSVLPWYNLVAPFIRSYNNEFSRMRPNLKQMSAYEQAFDSVPIGRRGVQLSEIIFLVDVSASMKTEYIDIFNEFAALLGKFNVTIRLLAFSQGLVDEYIFTTKPICDVKKSSGIFFEGRIPSDHVFRVSEFKQVFSKGFPNLSGRGGTSLAPALSVVYKKCRILPRLFIYTDGELTDEDYRGVQNLHKHHSNKTIWFITRGDKSDFGYYTNDDVLKNEVCYDITGFGRGVKNRNRRGRISV
jgi:hypothetical protein